MINLSLKINDRPSAFRYPRGSGTLNKYYEISEKIEIGKGYILKNGNNVAFLNLGTRISECIEASEELEKININPTIADARFAKPLDTKLIDYLIDNHQLIITIEEGSIGGFSSHLLNYIHNIRIKKNSSIIKNFFFPDRYIEHMKPEEQYAEIKMDSESLVKEVKKFYNPNILNIKDFKQN